MRQKRPKRKRRPTDFAGRDAELALERQRTLDRIFERSEGQPAVVRMRLSIAPGDDSDSGYEGWPGSTDLPWTLKTRDEADYFEKVLYEFLNALDECGYDALWKVLTGQGPVIGPRDRRQKRVLLCRMPLVGTPKRIRRERLQLPPRYKWPKYATPWLYPDEPSVYPPAPLPHSDTT